MVKWGQTGNTAKSGHPMVKMGSKWWHRKVTSRLSCFHEIVVRQRKLDSQIYPAFQPTQLYPNGWFSMPLCLYIYLRNPYIHNPTQASVIRKFGPKNKGKKLEMAGAASASCIFCQIASKSRPTTILHSVHFALLFIFFPSIFHLLRLVAKKIVWLWFEFLGFCRMRRSLRLKTSAQRLSGFDLWVLNPP